MTDISDALDELDREDELDDTLLVRKSVDAIERRLPTLQLIENGHIREATVALSCTAPPYFWKRPGSYSGYHHGHKHGLWLHTLKLSTVIESLFPSYMERDLLSPRERDYAHAAAILHDQRKNGRDPDSDSTSNVHDIVMADLIRETMIGDELGELVAQAIEQHMGPWGTGPVPNSVLNELVHTADMIASRKGYDIAIYEPVPEELEPHVRDTIEVPER